MTLDEFVNTIQNEDGNPASEDALVSFEAKIGSPLPKELREYLKCSGGGLIFQPSITYLDSEHRQLRLRYMNDLSKIDEEFTKPTSYPLPDGFLIIGSDAGGNAIMACMRTDRFGQIFLLDHELVAYEGEPDTLEEAEEYGLVLFYSPSFSQFLNDLRIER
ncbi:SMI1/KNR4 family protein [Agrobacterium sp. CG160-95]